MRGGFQRFSGEFESSFHDIKTSLDQIDAENFRAQINNTFQSQLSAYIGSKAIGFYPPGSPKFSFSREDGCLYTSYLLPSY